MLISVFGTLSNFILLDTDTYEHYPAPLELKSSEPLSQEEVSWKTFQTFFGNKHSQNAACRQSAFCGLQYHT